MARLLLDVTLHESPALRTICRIDPKSLQASASVVSQTIDSLRQAPGFARQWNRFRPKKS